MNIYESHNLAGFMLGLNLKSVSDGPVSSAFAILAGTGVPSGATNGGQTLESSQRALFLRADASDTDAALYITLNGGTIWTAIETLADLDHLIPGASSQKAIAGGVLTVTGLLHTILGAGASEDINTISGLADGEICFLYLADAAHNVVIKHGTDNIIGPRGQDVTLDATTDMVLVQRKGAAVVVLAYHLTAGLPTSSTTPGATGSTSTGLTAAGAVSAAPSATEANFYRLAFFFLSGPPAAKSATQVSARQEDNVAGGNWAGPFGAIDMPRNITITFEAAWAGGDVTVVGTDYADAALTEVIADNPGALVAGVKIFKTVTGATNELVGAGGVNHGATIGTGDKLWNQATKAAEGSSGFLCVSGVSVDGTVWDGPYNAFTPAAGFVPNGARIYDGGYPVLDTPPTPTHTHAAGAITITEVAHTHTSAAHTHNA